MDSSDDDANGQGSARRPNLTLDQQRMILHYIGHNFFNQNLSNRKALKNALKGVKRYINHLDNSANWPKLLVVSGASTNEPMDRTLVFIGTVRGPTLTTGAGNSLYNIGFALKFDVGNVPMVMRIATEHLASNNASLLTTQRVANGLNELAQCIHERVGFQTGTTTTRPLGTLAPSIAAPGVGGIGAGGLNVGLGAGGYSGNIFGQFAEGGINTQGAIYNI